MYKTFFFLIFISISSLSAQNENKWMLDGEKSLIEYSAKHLLHAWSGVNNDVKGVFLDIGINFFNAITLGIFIENDEDLTSESYSQII